MDFTKLNIEEAPPNICVIRLTTTAWYDKNGVYFRKTLRFLKRKCSGYNVLLEEASMDMQILIERVGCLTDFPDGVEEVDNKLELVWEDGNWYRIQTLDEIRAIVKQSL